MAYEQPGFKLTLIAAADLSSSQYLFVKVDSNGKAALASTGEAAIGVLQNKPKAGQAAEIAVTGITKVYSGGALTAGDMIKSDSAGKAATAVAGRTNTSDTGSATDPLIGSYVIGVSLATAAGSNLLIPVLLTHVGATSGTAA